MDTAYDAIIVGSALRRFADGDAPGPEGIPCTGRRPRDVPE